MKDRINSESQIANFSRDRYLSRLLPEHSEGKLRARSRAQELGVAPMSLSAAEAQMLCTFLRGRNCLRFVEIGTLTGLSAQYIMDALAPRGQLWTFEKSEKHAQSSFEILKSIYGEKQVEWVGETSELRARAETDTQFEQNSVRALKKVCIVQGDAEKRLKEIESFGPFDGIFIDGNKSAYGRYLDWAEKNLAKGSIIIADNVFLFGAVWDESERESVGKTQTLNMKAFNERLADPDRYLSCLIPTAQGMFVAIKNF